MYFKNALQMMDKSVISAFNSGNQEPNTGTDHTNEL